jgi:hypothetical protein
MPSPISKLGIITSENDLAQFPNYTSAHKVDSKERSTDEISNFHSPIQIEPERSHRTKRGTDTILDIVSTGYSAAELIRNPSWENAGYLGWDVAASFIPFVPGSYSAKAFRAINNTSHDAIRSSSFSHLKNPNATKVVIQKTGQFHHIFSKKVMDEINLHDKIQGLINRKDIIIQAQTKEVHQGYEGWHRELDKEIVEWLRKNKTKDVDEFMEFLRERYNQPDLIERFGRNPF